jgi:NAD(P)-dependent dehydrogenase (short-subunit alcohol dehydrogenase family)
MTQSREHAVIIGGTSGIGLATARLLAPRMRVTIAGRDATRLAEARRLLPDDVRGEVFDAAGPEPEDFYGRIGPFDHLVLALGSRRGLVPLAALATDELAAGFAEKVWPQVASTRAALPHLSKAGSITFVGAVSAHAAMPGTSGIAAANGALATVVPILAAELKPLRVNAVAPGVIDTPWWDFLPAEARQQTFAEFTKRTPVGRIGRAEDIAEAIAFLVTNRFVDGHVLVCDGGIRLAA